MDKYKDTVTKKAARDFRNALLKLMQQKDFSEITISELCKTAELSRSTFYRYYTNTNDVINDYFKSILKNYVLACDSIKYSEKNLKTGITERCRVFYKHIEENKKFYKIMFSSHGISGFQDIMQEIRVKRFLNRYSLKNDVNSNNYKDNLQFTLLAQYITYAQLGLAQCWLNGQMMLDIEAVAQMAADFTYKLLINYKDNLIINWE